MLNMIPLRYQQHDLLSSSRDSMLLVLCSLHDIGPVVRPPLLLTRLNSVLSDQRLFEELIALKNSHL